MQRRVPLRPNRTHAGLVESGGSASAQGRTPRGRLARSHSLARALPIESRADTGYLRPTPSPRGNRSAMIGSVANPLRLVPQTLEPEGPPQREPDSAQHGTPPAHRPP